MSNSEHLIENAIMCFESNGNFDHFRESRVNAEMAASVGISLADVERMAVHMIFVFKPDWVHEAEDKLIEMYGYDIRQQ